MARVCEGAKSSDQARKEKLRREAHDVSPGRDRHLIGSRSVEQHDNVLLLVLVALCGTKKNQ